MDPDRGSNGAALPDSVKVDVDSVQVIHNPLRPTGAFDSSSPLLNLIHRNIGSSSASTISRLT